MSDRSLLRVALALDAGVTAANGVVYLAAAGPVGNLLGLSSSLLRGAGAFLLVFAALLAAVAARRDIPRPPVRAVVGVNVVWAVASVLALVTGGMNPTLAGGVWIVVLAIVVAGFAELQVIGLRRGRC